MNHLEPQIKFHVWVKQIDTSIFSGEKIKRLLQTTTQAKGNLHIVQPQAITNWYSNTHKTAWNFIKKAVIRSAGFQRKLVARAHILLLAIPSLCPSVSWTVCMFVVLSSALSISFAHFPPLVMSIRTCSPLGIACPEWKKIYQHAERGKTTLAKCLLQCNKFSSTQGEAKSVLVTLCTSCHFGYADVLVFLHMPWSSFTAIDN